MENVTRTMNNLSSVFNWTAILSAEEVNYWLENFSDLVICRGRVRQVVFEPITDKNYKVYTKAS